MDIQDCIKFTNSNTICYFETIEEDQPRIRAMNSWFADESGFYFQILDIQPVYQHLQRNPKTEICFYKQENMTGTILRIAGELEFLSDFKLKEKLKNGNNALRNFDRLPDNQGFIIFKITHGIANFLTMENNIMPKEIIKF
jgi:pyridoxamine 5'-phosphate oxidase